MAHFVDSEARYQTVFKACLKAVRCGFPHLSEKHICEPPHAWFDAYLARQVLFHLMAQEFYVPRRRITIEFGIRRQMVRNAVNVIDERLSDDAFQTSYTAMRTRAELDGA